MTGYERMLGCVGTFCRVTNKLGNAFPILKYLKVFVLIQNLPPPTFFKHVVILVPQVELYFEGFMCEVACMQSV